MYVYTRVCGFFLVGCNFLVHLSGTLFLEQQVISEDIVHHRSFLHFSAAYHNEGNKVVTGNEMSVDNCYKLVSFSCDICLWHLSHATTSVTIPVDLILRSSWKTAVSFTIAVSAQLCSASFIDRAKLTSGHLHMFHFNIHIIVTIFLKVSFE